MTHYPQNQNGVMTQFNRQQAALRPLELLFWAALAFGAAQRFSFSFFASYACIVPWAAAVVCFRSNIARRNALLLLALFWSIDNSVYEFGATNAPVRYLIYATVMLSLVSDTVVQRSGAIASLTAALFYLTVTAFFADEGLNGYQAWRDVLTLILVGIIFSLKSTRPFGLDLEIIMFAMAGYLLSECVNFFIFKDAWYGEYMSYNTTKYLIVVPSILAFLAKRNFIAILIIAITFPVLIGYTHRTLLISYIISLAVIFFFVSIRDGAIKRSLISVIFVFFVFLMEAIGSTFSFEGNKALNMFSLISIHGIGALEILDPVRYATSTMYFQLPLFEVLFGRGFGSGILDTGNALGFVRFDQSAFTELEIQTGLFYNFHDFWVDIGLRFGLLPLLAFLYWLLRLRPTKSREGIAFWFIALIGITSGFYGTSGMISIFLLIRVVQSYRANDV